VAHAGVTDAAAAAMMPAPAKRMVLLVFADGGEF
jgi:hypothetical protein